MGCAAAQAAKQELPVDVGRGSMCSSVHTATHCDGEPAYPVVRRAALT
jgi:hypothetical protein